MRIQGSRSSNQVWSAGITLAGSSKLHTVTSISGASGLVRNVSGVPQYGQNARQRPAHRIPRGNPVSNLKSSQRKEAQVTKGAPLLRRQSAQWQWVMLWGVPVTS